ncbi:hypothetical protein JQC91_01565 [Jannaschia sp. Os4]|uniref:hypothetical protein n=1 Tax=Jannaschia sp. Os4 TaxID=2807617 RepID=UPI00193A11B1|nr:hypothetical protein [Jannaschia sp. Os4]MBM2574979.1 hypothetical protein [Jannaschia sp. Os4]
MTKTPQDGNSIYGFTCAQSEEDEKTGELNFIALIRASQAGEEIAADRFPDEMWIRKSSNERKKLRHIFMANGLFAVSGAFAEIMSRHDMGPNTLHPVRLLKKNRRTAYEGEYLLLNLCAKKEGFDPERSRNFQSSRHPLAKGRISGIFGHDDFAVSSAVLDGPDLWMDPTLFSSHFVKGAFAEELIAARMFHRTLPEREPLARCRVIGPDGAELAAGRRASVGRTHPSGL